MTLETWKPSPSAPTLSKACEAQSHPPGSRSSKGALPAGSKGPTGSALFLHCMPPGTSRTMTEMMNAAATAVKCFQSTADVELTAPSLQTPPPSLHSGSGAEVDLLHCPPLKLNS